MVEYTSLTSMSSFTMAMRPFYTRFFSSCWASSSLAASSFSNKETTRLSLSVKLGSFSNKETTRLSLSVPLGLFSSNR